jgi:hypothetical protein
MVLTGRQDNLKLRQNSSYKNNIPAAAKNNSTLILKEEGRLDYKREEIRFQGKLKLILRDENEIMKYLYVYPYFLNISNPNWDTS